MFFIDKYAPKTIDEICFHDDIIRQLKKMSGDDSIPHIIFYGPEGSGKKTLINFFLEMIFDKHVHNLSDTNYTVTGSGNIVTQVAIKQSNYHIVIDPNNNNFDRYLIQDVVKEYAKRVPLGVFTKKKNFKIVLINNVDNLSYYAQTSLRRTMENYSGTCRFIMWCRSLSKVIDPLRSRCYCLKIRLPTDSELLGLLINISGKEGINVKLKDYDTILELSKGNIKKSLWLLELYKFGENYETDYDDIINDIIKLLLTCNIKNIFLIRDYMYKIMITNITGSQIIKDIVEKLLEIPFIPFECKMDIVEIAATYEHNLNLGRREIIHLEAFINNIIMVLKIIDKKKIRYNKSNKSNIC